MSHLIIGEMQYKSNLPVPLGETILIIVNGPALMNAPSLFSEKNNVIFTCIFLYASVDDVAL